MKQIDFIEFDFQEIPLQEAVRLSAGFGGKYEALAIRLIEKLPELISQEKTLAFGLPGGKELSEAMRRGVSAALSSRLKKAHINFRVTYSSTRKLFLVIPSKNFTPVIPTTLPPDRTQKRSAPPSKSPFVGKSRRLALNDRAAASKNTLSWFLPFALRTTGVSADTLQKAPREVRKAITKIAIKKLGVRIQDMTKPLGISPGGVKYLLLTSGAERTERALAAAIDQAHNISKGNGARA